MLSSQYEIDLAKLYMKSRTDLYTTSMVTTWDAYISVVGIPCALLIPPLCHYYGKLIPVNTAMLTAYYAAIILIVWNVPNKVLMSAFFMENIFRSGLAQTYYSWIATLCSDNVEKKAIVLSWVQALSYGTNAYAVTLQYDLSGSPRFRKGYIINIVIIAASHIVFFIGLFLDKYDLKYIPQFSGNRNNIQKDNIIDENFENQNINDFNENIENLDKVELYQKEKKNYDGNDENINVFETKLQHSDSNPSVV